ncbi:hypothetical protein IGK74_002397 [Enterococcus sp. AZ150]|uniref:hypothetical protein n=1 Tax=Enterococcus sp. AZ150 TaxID=2774866 RepID=UPI003F210B54
MKDMWMEVYNVLLSNDIIAEKVGKNNIKFYEAVETLDTTKPFIIIDSFNGPQTTAYHIADKIGSIQFSFQINVESQNRLLTKEIAKAVKEVMWAENFGQLNGGLDTYFSETKRFVDARRYRKNTKLYDVEY